MPYKYLQRNCLFWTRVFRGGFYGKSRHGCKYSLLPAVAVKCLFTWSVAKLNTLNTCFIFSNYYTIFWISSIWLIVSCKTLAQFHPHKKLIIPESWIFPMFFQLPIFIVWFKMTEGQTRILDRNVSRWR